MVVKVIQMALNPAAKTAFRFLVAVTAYLIFIFVPPHHMPNDGLQDLKERAYAAVAAVTMVPITHNDEEPSRTGKQPKDEELSKILDPRKLDVSSVIDNSKGVQQPDDDANHHDNVEDLFDLSVHRDVGIDKPEQHAHDNQRYDDRNQRHNSSPFKGNGCSFMSSII
jgi:hypothetical protein